MPERAIGIVIPCFGHPQFLAEAIVSACEQTCDFEIKVVVVDDGCRFSESGKVVEGLMALYPGKLHYLRQENTKLPGARNTGVRFLLDLLPDIDSIYFLDADNRLSEYSIQAFRDALGNDPEVGWAYPDIAMFGLTSMEAGFTIKETALRYSRLLHLMGNISEAGSLVRASVFKAGVFYDESMKSGLEDWDFWLSALMAGFVGVRTPNAGFMYRRRPESMLADSRRQQDSLITGMRNKHKALFAPKALLALEEREAPYFAVSVIGREEIYLLSDPFNAPKKVSHGELFGTLKQWLLDEREVFTPQSFLVMSEEEWIRLQSKPADQRWLWWKIKEFKHPWAFIYRRAGSLPRTTAIDASKMEHLGVEAPHTLAISLEAVWHILAERKGLEQISEPAHLLQLTSMCQETPGAAAEKTDMKAALMAGAHELFERFSPSPGYEFHHHRKYSGPSSAFLHRLLINPICAAEGREAFPANKDTSRVSLLVELKQVSLPSFANALEALHKRLRLAFDEIQLIQFIPHNARADIRVLEPIALHDSFVPVELVNSVHEETGYLGRSVGLTLDSKQKDEVAILCRSSDLIVSLGANAGVEAFGQARNGYVQTAVWLDGSFEEYDVNMRERESKLLAFEHAIGTYICDDLIRADLLAAEGIPSAKFMSSRKFIKKEKMLRRH